MSAPAAGPRLRVGIVDDSAVARALLSALVETQSDMQVVGTAADPHSARHMIRETQPDVITLDVEMPRMHGLDFLQRLMQAHPMPVVMVSALTERGSDITVRALELGAVDFVAKPASDDPITARLRGQELLAKLRAAGSAKVGRAALAATMANKAAAPSSLSNLNRDLQQTLARLNALKQPALAGNLRATASASPRPVMGVGMAPVSPPSMHTATMTSAHDDVGCAPSTVLSHWDRMIGIGASTGGTEALKEFLTHLPADCPPILIVQHMPEQFTASLARRLDSLSRLRVTEAVDGEPVQAGHAYVAPGHSHLLIERQGAGHCCRLSKADPVNRHRPSVDVLFHAMAEVLGARTVGVIMTGMGKDGAQGLAAMRKAGGLTLGQDEASCVVYGMPREAMALGAVAEELPLLRLAPRAMELARLPLNARM